LSGDQHPAPGVIDMTSPSDNDSSETIEEQAEPQSAAEPVRPDPLDKMSRSVTFVGAMIGLVVTGTAWLSSCDTNRAQSFKSFREAVAGEETYWKSLYSDYQAIFTKDFDGRLDQRRARIRAIYTLAQREPATFAEFAVPDLERAQASGQITTMKTSLLNALTDTDPVLADELRARVVLARGGEQAAAPAEARSDAARPAEKQATAPPPLPTTNIVQLSPPHETGWDVDLFWCRGANYNANYQTTVTIGNGLAAFAISGRTIAPSVALGRVRIRPANRQQPPGPANGLTVVHDIGPGEAEAGRAVMDAIAGTLGPGAPRFTLLRSNGARTPWLISAFVCPSASPPTAIANRRQRLAR
jgi:hypothetical protein